MEKDRKTQPSIILLRFPKRWLISAGYFVRTFVKLAFILSLIVLLAYLFNRYWVSDNTIHHDRFLSYMDKLKWIIFLIAGYFLLRPWMPDFRDYIIKKVSANGVEFDLRAQQQNEQADVEQPSVDISSSAGRQIALKDVNTRYELEKLYRIIFGTQLKALLSVASNSFVPFESLQALLDEHRALAPYIYENIPNFMGFLTRSMLVEQVDSGYKITSFGLLFIQYLTEENLLNTALKNF